MKENEPAKLRAITGRASFPASHHSLIRSAFASLGRSLALPVLLALTAVSALANPGDLDSTFGIGGKVTTPLSGYGSANSVAVQSEGKIVVAGSSWDANTGHDFALVRYNIDRSLDTRASTAQAR